MFLRPGWWVRYGGLSPVKQKHRLKEDDAMFHTPPRRRGVFAFVDGFVEHFLIGSTCKINHPSNKVYRLYDESGKTLCFEEHADFHCDTGGCYPTSKKLKKLLKKQGLKEKQIVCVEDEPAVVGILRHPRTFYYDGVVWHHLRKTTEEKAIIDEWGAWILTSLNDWETAFRKNVHTSRSALHAYVEIGEKRPNWHNFSRAGALAKLPFGGRTAMSGYEMDSLEVFIERPH